MDFVYGLTGSPLLENPADLFGVLRAVAPSLLGTDFRVFLSAFFDPVPGSETLDGRLRWRPKLGALVELAGVLHAVGFHRDRSELDQRMPRQHFAPPLVFDLDPAVRRAYARIQRDAERAITLRGLAMQRAAVRLEKLAQAARGWVFDAGGG